MFKFICATLLCVCLSGCGGNTESPTPAPKPTKAHAINSTQLEMIDSADATISRLAWASITASLNSGATPSPVQIEKLRSHWEHPSSPESARARLSWELAHGQQSPAWHSWENAEDLALLTSNDLLDSAKIDHLESDPLTHSTLSSAKGYASLLATTGAHE